MTHILNNMILGNRLVVLFLLVTVSLCAETVEKVPVRDVRDVFSQQEFLRAGLNKLSEQELRELNGTLYGWKEIRKSDPQPVSLSVTAREEQSFGEETVEQAKKKVNDDAKAKEISTIVSQIIGEFKGWQGRAVFELSNGQVWRQVDDNKFVVRATDPRVEISKGFLGTYYLSIEGYGSRCKVKRVK